MTSRLRVSAVLLTALVLLAACTSEEPLAAPVASTATESTSTPAPIVSPTPLPPPEGERRTGSPQLDQVIAAVELRDIAALASLVQYQEIGCTHADGMGGPPKCDHGRTEGEILRVFPGAECHGYWTDTATQLLGTFAHRAQGLYAVAAVEGDASLGGEWPAADTLLIFHADWFGEPAAFRLHIAEGRIVASWSGCGPRTPAELVDAGIEGAVSLIAGPWEDRLPQHVEVPVTGTEGLDAVLGAVARYDILTLIDSAQRGMQTLPDVGCVAASRIPGDVTCDAGKGEQPGDGVDVLPLTSCGPEFMRDQNQALRGFLDEGPVLHSVLHAPDEESSGLFQHGRYWLVYEMTAAPDSPPGAVRLQIGESGELLRVWHGCAPTLRELVQWEQAPLPRLDVRLEVPPA